MVPPRIVLLRPRNADNLGAVARCLKNFGIVDWCVVSPNPKLLEVPGMHRLAVHAGDLLESVRRVDTLEEAVADCHWVVGTTSRTLPGQRRLLPRELASSTHALPGATAWVFGDERSGLSNDDLGLCHAVSFIPASAAQPSLNLAQAVVVYGYEWHQRAAGFSENPPPPGPKLADHAHLLRLRETMKAALVARGFLRDSREHALDALMSPLTRSRLESAEADLFMAAFHVIAEGSKG